MVEYRKMTQRDCIETVPENLEPMSAGEVGSLADIIGHGGVYLLPHEQRHQCSVICGPHVYRDRHGGGAWVGRDALKRRLKEWVEFWDREGVPVPGFAMVAFSTGINDRNLPVLRVYSLRDDYYVAVVVSMAFHRVYDFSMYHGKNYAFICDQTRGLLRLVSDIVPNMVRKPEAG
jgi:hypothetical protein